MGVEQSMGLDCMLHLDVSMLSDRRFLGVLVTVFEVCDPVAAWTGGA